jgi:hypothetical protein
LERQQEQCATLGAQLAAAEQQLAALCGSDYIADLEQQLEEQRTALAAAQAALAAAAAASGQAVGGGESAAAAAADDADAAGWQQLLEAERDARTSAEEMLCALQVRCCVAVVPGVGCVA